MAIKNSGSGDGLPLFSLYPNTKEIHLHMLFNLFNREWKSLNSHHLSTLCGMNTNVRYHDRKRGKKPKKICYSDTNGCFVWNRHASKCIACISVISNGTTVSRVSLLMQDVIRVSLQEQSVHVYIKRDNNVGLHCVKSSLQKRTHIWKFPCAKQWLWDIVWRKFKRSSHPSSCFLQLGECMCGIQQENSLDAWNLTGYGSGGSLMPKFTYLAVGEFRLLQRDGDALLYRKMLGWAFTTKQKDSIIAKLNAA